MNELNDCERKDIAAEIRRSKINYYSLLIKPFALNKAVQRSLINAVIT